MYRFGKNGLFQRQEILETPKLLFIVSLSYIKPLEDINQHLEGHREFLKKYYERGSFIASGAKAPRTGGVIIARFSSQEALLSALDEDPFKQNELANYEIQAFNASMMSDVLIQEEAESKEGVSLDSYK